MPLPDFNDLGDLPAGVYNVAFDEVVERFGGGSQRRKEVTARLRHIWELAFGTGEVDRLILFGSYVTNKESPNDVDVVLLMREHFELRKCPSETLALFDHQKAADDTK